MNDIAIIIAMAAALVAGGIVGTVGVLGIIAATLHRAAGASALLGSAVPGRGIGFTATEPELEIAKAEFEASDALEAERERNFRLDGGYGPPPEASKRPTANARPKKGVPGCGYCKALRKAIFGRF